nr:hypothetical protein [Candidatus Bathyarchaeota archaeon]
MEARRVCLGFDVLIDYPRGRREAVDHIRRLEEAAVLSTISINAFKVYYGACKSGREKNVRTLGGYGEACDPCSTMRQRRQLGEPSSLELKEEVV